MAEISVNDLSREIVNALKTYTYEVSEGLEKAKVEVAKNAVKKLKVSSRKLTGDYAKGWRVKREYGALIIHNETDYQLTHLLEFGHVITNGDGITYGRTRAFPHIRPVEEEAIDEFTKKVEKVIKGG